MTERVLYGYYRSSAAYRVRIALNLKGLEYRQQAVNLLRASSVIRPIWHSTRKGWCRPCWMAASC
jgi:hypothetical protein